MQSIGFTSREIEQILILLAAVLHIGDIVRYTLYTIYCTYMYNIYTYTHNDEGSI